MSDVARTFSDGPVPRVTSVTFDVYGIPQPQGSKQAFIRGGRAIVVEGSNAKGREAFHSWRDAIARAARDSQADVGGFALLDGPLAVWVTFYLPRPKSAPKRRLYPDGRPDIDKLARSVADAITGVLIVDDARIVDLQVHKRYAVERPPGARISVGEVVP